MLLKGTVRRVSVTDQVSTTHRLTKHGETLCSRWFDVVRSLVTRQWVALQRDTVTV